MTKTSSRAEKDREIFAKADETARAFAELSAAIERRMYRIVGMEEGSPALGRARLAVTTGALAADRNGRKWISLAHDCMEGTRHYWMGLFRHPVHLPEADRPIAEGAAELWERESEHVMGSVATAAEALAHVMAAIVAELEAADAANDAAAKRQARRAA